MPEGSYGTTVARARAERGWSQRKLAAKCGVTQPAISRVESNKRKPRLVLQVKIEKVLGVKP